jgi:uncharacterized protein (DUF1330 family)
MAKNQRPREPMLRTTTSIIDCPQQLRRKLWPRDIGSPSIAQFLTPPRWRHYGGRFLARGGTVKTYEQGIAQRAVVAEFDSVEQAIAAHDSPAYQAALAVLGNTCERDVRIVEGVDGS